MLLLFIQQLSPPGVCKTTNYPNPSYSWSQNKVHCRAGHCRRHQGKCLYSQSVEQTIICICIHNVSLRQPTLDDVRGQRSKVSFSDSAGYNESNYNYYLCPPLIILSIWYLVSFRTLYLSFIFLPDHSFLHCIVM